MATLNELTSGTSGGYPDRVAALSKPSDDTLALVQQLVGLQMKQNSLQQAANNVPNTGDHLKSLPGVLALLSAAGVTAAGGAQGADVGAGMVKGFVQGAEGAQASEQQKIAAEQKQTQDLLQQQRQHLVTLLQSRPEMFIDPETGESLVDPRMLGFTATGFMMPINPGVNYRLTKQTESQKRLVDIGISLMKDGDTPAKRRQGALIVDKALDLRLGGDFYESIMGQDDAGAWNTIFSNDNLDQNYSLEARVYALTHNKTLDDPEVVGMLRKAAKDEGPLTMDKYTVGLIARHNERMANADPSLLNLPIEDQIKYTMGDTPGDAAALTKFYLGQDAFGSGVPGSVIINNAARNSELMRMIYSLNPNDPMFVKNGITSEAQIWEKSLDGMQGVVADYTQGLQEATIQNYGIKLAELTGELMMRNPEWQEGAASAEAYKMLEGFRAQATSPVTHRLDVAKFNSLVQAFYGSK